MTGCPYLGSPPHTVYIDRALNVSVVLFLTIPIPRCCDSSVNMIYSVLVISLSLALFPLIKALNFHDDTILFVPIPAILYPVLMLPI